MPIAHKLMMGAIDPDPVELNPALPADVTHFDPGQPVTLTIEVTGGTLPYTYQWYKNASPLIGETSITLDTISPLSGVSDSYHCQVTNPAGSVNSVTSAVNTLTLNVDSGTFTSGSWLDVGSGDIFYGYDPDILGGVGTQPTTTINVIRLVLKPNGAFGKWTAQFVGNYSGLQYGMQLWIDGSQVSGSEIFHAAGISYFDGSLVSSPPIANGFHSVQFRYYT